MSQKESPFLFFTPSILIDVRVQMIKPPFSALFSHSIRDVASDMRPFGRTELLDYFYEEVIFFLGPCSFGEKEVFDYALLGGLASESLIVLLSHIGDKSIYYI